MQLDRLPQIECTVLLDVQTRKAVQQLSLSKALGADAIPAEVYKAGGLPMAEKLPELFHFMWMKEAIPQEFMDASITCIHLYVRTSEKEILMSVTTTKASLSYPLLGRYWQKLC